MHGEAPPAKGAGGTREKALNNATAAEETSMTQQNRQSCRESATSVIGALSVLAIAASLLAQPAQAADAQPSWMKDAALVAAAKKEGEVTLISSLAEEVA